MERYTDWMRHGVKIGPSRDFPFVSLMPAVTRPREKSRKCRSREGRCEEIVMSTDQTKAYSTLTPCFEHGAVVAIFLLDSALSSTVFVKYLWWTVSTISFTLCLNLKTKRYFIFITPKICTIHNKHKTLKCHSNMFRHTTFHLQVAWLATFQNQQSFITVRIVWLQ
jgi:hypothetical protein